MFRVIALTVCTLAIAVAADAQGQPQATPATAPGGRGTGVNGGRRPAFPQQMRPLAPPEVLARGRAVFGVNCAACHGADLRGGDQGGPSLLRSLAALSDQHGEVIAPIVHGARQDKGMPAFNLGDSDTIAVAEYIHSVLAKVGSQARPPGAVDPSTLNVLVGSASAGKVYFDAKCASCHSVSGDLRGIASKYPDPRSLQNTWVAPGGGRGFGRGGDENRKLSTVTVAMPGGQKLEGTLVRKDDFVVTLVLSDGTRKSIARDGDTPKVEVHDPYDAHKKLMPALTNAEMHDVTAYLAKLK